MSEEVRHYCPIHHWRTGAYGIAVADLPPHAAQESNGSWYALLTESEILAYARARQTIRLDARVEGGFTLIITDGSWGQR